MKRTALALALAWLGGCAGQTDTGVVTLDTQARQEGYAIGFQAGSMFRQAVDDVDHDAFLHGIRVALDGDEARQLMTVDEVTATAQAFQERKQAEAEATRQQQLVENLAAGSAYREQLAARPGVTLLESGILIERLQESAQGSQPAIADTVVAHYQGSLIDGTVFDSSLERGEPATFPLRRVIPAWQEVVPMMRTGDKWRITVPPEMAYGEQGAGAAIPPNSTLIFEIELLELNPQG